MARRAKFGRSSRVAPSLASEAISIARQMQNAEDNNIMSAWQGGGTFEGKQVTDAMVLAYWTARKKDLAANDPLSDTVGEQLEQLKYGIAQSKQQVLYDQKKISGAQFAQFYINWEKKVPKNSEFYRTLQKNAANLIQSEQANGRAAAAAAKDKAFASFANGVQGGPIALGETITSVMTQIARDHNLIGATQDIGDFMLDGQGDPGHMEELLAAINVSLKDGSAQSKAFIASIKKLDPSWNGQLTTTYWTKVLKGQNAGYNTISARANKEGRSSWVKWAKKQSEKTSAQIVQSIDMPVGSSYGTAREQFDAVNGNPKATEQDKADARAVFAKQLGLIVDANPKMDTASKNRILNDIYGLTGDPKYQPQASYSENYNGATALTLGSNSPDGKVTGEGAKWFDSSTKYNLYSADSQANPGAYLNASVLPGSDPPAFDPSGKGPVGLVTAASVQASTGSQTVVPTMTLGGDPIMVVVNIHDVYAEGADGKRVIVGQVADYQRGSSTERVYKTDAGWTYVAPWAGNVTAAPQENGDVKLTVPPPTLTAGDAAAYAASLKASGFAGAAEIATAFEKGNPPDGTQWKYKVEDPNTGTSRSVTVDWKGGQFVQSIDTTTGGLTGATTSSSISGGSQVISFTNGVPSAGTGPDVKTLVMDPTRGFGAPDPLTFPSATLAALMHGDVSPTDIAAYYRDPAFITQLTSDEWERSGHNEAAYADIARADAKFAADLISKGPPEAAIIRGGRVYEPAHSRRDLVYPTTDPRAEQTATGRISIGTKLTVPDAGDVIAQLGPGQQSDKGAYATVAPAPYAPQLGPPKPQTPGAGPDKNAYATVGPTVAPPVVHPATPGVTPPLPGHEGGPPAAGVPTPTYTPPPPSSGGTGRKLL